MYVDVGQSPKLAEYFGVTFGGITNVPDSCVIVDNVNGSYMYVQSNGKVTNDRSQARILGYDDAHKQIFIEILNQGIEYDV